MTFGPVHVGRPDEAVLAKRLRQAAQAEVTYDHIRSTMDDGPNVRSESLVVGQGQHAFDQARAALRAWAPQRAIGAHVVPGGAVIEEGTTLLVVLVAGPFAVVAPNRVVAVVDEPGRYAYAYGTLPGHPERGEESFTVALDSDGVVTATIRVQDRPVALLARLARPAVRVFQAAAIRKYLLALREKSSTA